MGPKSREFFGGSSPSTPVVRWTECPGCHPVRLHVRVPFESVKCMRERTLRSPPLLSANMIRKSSVFENSGSPYLLQCRSFGS